ncbi:MAG TPA: MerR family transcriptional regulator [Actinomycetes bacterium]|nr:MerR family transcriptional regulator [Actinomycetes bacterium]
MSDPARSTVASRDGYLSIGQFARLSGLSIGALRHYDELGIITPSRVDRDTSYRQYRHEQLDDARLVATLRELELPLEEIRELLASDDPIERRAVLIRHRNRLDARVTRLGRVLHQLMHLIDPSTPQEETMTKETAVASELDAQTQKALAASLFNRVWELLEQTDRTAVDDDEMVNAAHASRFLWTAIGDDQNFAIGDWQIGRVYSVLGRAEPAVFHARRCLDHATKVDGQPWLLASAYEGLARAYAVAGDRAAALEWKAKAEARLKEVDDAEDREIVERDIATLPV